MTCMSFGCSHKKCPSCSYHGRCALSLSLRSLSFPSCLVFSLSLLSSDIWTFPFLRALCFVFSSVHRYMNFSAPSHLVFLFSLLSTDIWIFPFLSPYMCPGFSLYFCSSFSYVVRWIYSFMFSIVWFSLLFMSCYI